ncbi:hypothetical protein [Cellulomonas sp. Leaf334]|uniref:hypothetical protein n=1 Tax=Cellulomonas sp. Leaf334 TaxID=1736339 RepID=UPI000700E6D7|nr:hypothetical protein [Cellulomonas sp. Leaf334]KQR10327.1 hypothetical protein ASF78_16670 [Cellulomonas sp. Leaf334]
MAARRGGVEGVPGWSADGPSGTVGGVPDAAVLAAANNAAWCDVVCRAHGLPTTTGAGLWSTPRRSPDGYPDAATLRPGVPVADVLGSVDDAPGASVKDSFADLDLAPHGWTVLFEAQWLTRASGPPTTPELPWRTVDRALLPLWLAAHGSAAITSDVVDDPAVRLLLAADEDGPLAVAALNLSGTSDATVVGVSNVHAVREAPLRVWSDLAAVARRELGAHPLVGYEAGPDLDPAVAVGFAAVGPLRVWVR